MNKKVKKSIMLFLVVLLLVSLVITGCQKTIDSKTESKTEPGETQQKAEQNGDSKDETDEIEDTNLVGNVYKTGLPIVKEPINVKIAAPLSTLSKKSIAEKEYTKHLEEVTNIRVEWLEIPQEDATEKVNIIFASGDLPDALMRCVNDLQLLNNYNSGLLLPLGELIDEWAPNIKRDLESGPWGKMITLPDGKIYSVPAGELSPWTSIGDQIFINKQWLDNLGLQMPKTTEDFHNVLKAFKENDANGNGDPNDEIPISFVGISNMARMLGAFELACDDKYLMVKDGKVLFVPATDNFKQAMDYFHMLYSEGLIDPESFSQNVNQLRAKGKSTTAPLLGCFIQFLVDITVGVEYADQYELVEPLEGPNGDKEYQPSIQKPEHGLVISAKTEHAEALIRWVDYMNADQYTKCEAEYGLESQGIWRKVEGEKFRTGDDRVPEGLSWGEWRFTEAWGIAPIFLPPDWIEQYRLIDERAGMKLDFVNRYKPFLVEEVIPAVIIEQKLNEEISSIQVELDILVQDFMAKSIMEGASDSDWTVFKSNLEKARYKRFEELHQQIYDKYK